MVELKKKVTLKTKVEEKAIENEQAIQQTVLPVGGKGKKLGIFIMLFVIAIIAFFLLKPKKSSNDTAVSPQVKSEVAVKNTNNVPKKKVVSEITSKEEVTFDDSIEEKAKLVIRGDFGNGKERKIKLGSEYSTIQTKVNEMYAKGIVN